MKKLVLNLLTLGFITTGLSGCNAVSKRLTIVHFDQSILGDAQKELGVSIGIKKGNVELQNALNSALATIDINTRNIWMSEAVDRANGNLSTTVTVPSTVPTDSNLPVLTIGLECNYQPFNWTETKESAYTYPIKGTNQFAEGYDIQMARYLASTMNYRLEVVRLEWDALIPALKSDSINAVIAGMTETEERLLSIDFSNEYYRSELVLVVREDDELAKATSLSDFNGKKIVSQIKTITNDVIDTWVEPYGVKHVAPLKTFATCAIAVRNGSADAMTAELPVATSIVNSNR